jgi:hypothetical protein
MSTNPQDGSRPTVVLVHGAFADASGWNEVVERLQAEGVQVKAPPNPLRGISVDSSSTPPAPTRRSSTATNWRPSPPGTMRWR